ncbi:MAG: hypothetical protein RIC06_25895 [Cyclobacteriaceae bacterium]
MKYIISKLTLFSLLLIACIACGPRVELDLTKYGDTAFIQDARLFYLEQADRQIFEGEGTITGVRRVFFSNGTTIDNDNFTATISVSAADAALLSESGITFTHQAMSIEPLEGAPRAGVSADFSGGNFVYRVHSADGTTHDWTIIIEVV